ncbi:MAG TPA: M14 family metallopeptidase [Vicinamibacterales bacterium]|nr:M14 family metallopeptidase [Vicinamibacterales bacterium]
MPTRKAAVALLLFMAQAAPQAQKAAAPKLTTPKEQFGWNVGDDYRLVNYTQYVEYVKKLGQQSDRMTVVEIGKTEEGRPELTAIITSPENHKKLAQYKEMNRKLALGEVNDDQARQLAKDGKTVVWIDGGLHATEVLGAQQLIETIYRLDSKTDPETMRILNDDIILCTLINPDGMELVSNWYMREADEQKRSTNAIPRLYEKYIGHDDNRDFYMMNMSESVNANKMMYREWYPAIMYNHHQTGPAGAVLFAPPFRDPFNYNFDPLIPLGIDMVGSAIHTRLAAEGKQGAVMRSGAPYSTWFNGGIRTTSYFHNQIGILTETIGNPTPVEIPFVLDMQLPRADVPNPIAPRTFHFREAIEYSVTNNYAILDIASKRKEDFLFNMYRMAKNAIAKGSTDTWTIHPKRIKAAEEAIAAQAGGRASGPEGGRGGRGGGNAGRGGAPMSVYTNVLHDPNMRDPRGFIVPSDQPDFLTATKFVNILIKAGVVVHRATAPFTVAGKSYPAGSYVVKAAQPFRAHVMDMFEPQDHPDDIPYPGGAPRPPYDVTGYNIAYSMGIKFDRILDAFDGPFEKIPDLAPLPAGRVAQAPAGGGYLLNHQVNDAFIAVNRLLKANEDVYWLKSAVTANGKTYPVGTMFITAKASTLPVVQKLASDKGLVFDAVAAKPAGDSMKLKPVRIGLWDQYGGSMPSGWTRWVFEQYEFPFEVVYPQMLDAGNLNAKYDVLVFVDGGIPGRDGSGGGGGGGFGAQPAADSIPAEFRGWLGRVTVSKTIPELKKFVENGGTVLTIGSSTALGYHLGLPVRDALVETVNGATRSLPREKYYVPGSILEARIDNTQPLAYGMDAHAMVFYDESPAFRLQPDAAAQNVKPIAWYESPTPLRSGWAWGQQYLDQAVSIIEAPVGKGHVVLFGNEVLWRAQPHGTFKMFFNGIYYGSAAQQAGAPRTTEQP